MPEILTDEDRIYLTKDELGHMIGEYLRIVNTKDCEVCNEVVKKIESLFNLVPKEIWAKIERPIISPFKGVQPNLNIDSTEVIIKRIKIGQTTVVDWDWAARFLNMSVEDLKKRIEK